MEVICWTHLLLEVQLHMIIFFDTKTVGEIPTVPFFISSFIKDGVQVQVQVHTYKA